MKKTTPVSLVLAIAAIISYSNLSAQVTKAFGNTSTIDIVTIEGISARIANLYTLDSVKAPHVASFEIEISSSAEVRRILTTLFSAMQGNKPLKLVVDKLNHTNQVMEERSYFTATVNEILLPDLNSASKELPRLKVTIESQDFSIKYDLDDKPKQTPALVKGALTNNFKFVMGSLPTQRVTISNIRINRQISNGYLNFSVEVVRADARPWKEWFNNGAGSEMRAEATILLLDQSLQNTIASFQLSEVEIVSASETNSSQEILKTIFGLRARRIEFMK